MAALVGGGFPYALRKKIRKQREKMRKNRSGEDRRTREHGQDYLSSGGRKCKVQWKNDISSGRFRCRSRSNRDASLSTNKHAGDMQKRLRRRSDYDFGAANLLKGKKRGRSKAF